MVEMTNILFPLPMNAWEFKAAKDYIGQGLLEQIETVQHFDMETSKDYKYRIGQVVKWRSALLVPNSEKERQYFGTIISFEHDEIGNLWYRIEEYPQKSEFIWCVPEQNLSSVTLMEM